MVPYKYVRQIVTFDGSLVYLKFITKYLLEATLKF